MRALETYSPTPPSLGSQIYGDGFPQKRSGLYPVAAVHSYHQASIIAAANGNRVTIHAFQLTGEFFRQAQ